MCYFSNPNHNKEVITMEPIGRPTATTPPIQPATTSTTQTILQGVGTASSTLEPATPRITESEGFCSEVRLCFKSIVDTVRNIVSTVMSWIKDCFGSRAEESAQSQPDQVLSSSCGQSIDEQLDQIFSSSSKTQQLFTIEGSRVGVIFNPGGEALRVGFMTVQDPVVLSF